jgi:hypothetical protein
MTEQITTALAALKKSKFCCRFKLTDPFKAPVERPIQMKAEDMYIEMAKGEQRNANSLSGNLIDDSYRHIIHFISMKEPQMQSRRQGSDT